MTAFTINVTDAALLSSITAARNDYNQTKGLPKSLIILNDTDFITMLLTNIITDLGRKFNLVITASQKADMENIIKTAIVKG